jgi:hypothetical protein
VVNILESKMKNVMLGLKKEVSKQVIAGSSTTLTTLQTLNGMTTAAGTGWLEGVTAANQQNTVGGLSQGHLPGTELVQQLLQQWRQLRPVAP